MSLFRTEKGITGHGNVFEQPDLLRRVTEHYSRY